MEIIQTKEKLILTNEEKAIFLKAFQILEDIYDNSECSGDLESYSRKAKNGLGDILDEAETENEASGIVTITLSF